MSRFWIRNNEKLRYLPSWQGAVCYVLDTETWWIFDSGWREGRPLPPPLPPPVEPGR